MTRAPLFLHLNETDLQDALWTFVEEAGYDLDTGDTIEVTLEAKVVAGVEKPSFVYVCKVV